MAKIVGIFGDSGIGKTTSTIVNPDGSFNFEKGEYKGMDPKSHFIINLDRKELPFPSGMWGREQKNYTVASNMDDIKKALAYCAKNPDIKSVALDTINIYLAMKEYNDRKKMSFDQWRDVVNDIIEINNICNTMLRDDQIVYIFGHTMLQTAPDGTEKIVLSVIGKKLTKTPPEAYYPIVLISRIDWGDDGDNNHLFQTKANRSSAKTPLGMFDEYEIPNSLALVDAKVRKYYNM